MKKFNLRVYGLIVNQKSEVLLSDEYRFGTFFTKFPGGGIEFGEGILEALKRELIEELNFTFDQAIPIYFNDFYQESAFQKEEQLVAFYYLISCKKGTDLGTDHSIPFYAEGEKQRWVSLNSIKEEELSFPIDKIAMKNLKKYLLIS